MDIQKIISQVTEKLNLDPALLKQFTGNPIETLKKTFNIDLSDDQLMEIVKGVASKLNLGDLDLAKGAAGLMDKFKGLFGK